MSIAKSFTFEGRKYNLDDRDRVAAAASSILDHEVVTENGTACSVDIPLTILNHDGDEAVTLADGTAVGQVKVFIATTNNTVTLTPATTAGAYATIATTNIGETYQLIWTASGWAVTGRNSGDTQAENAVDDLPTLA